MDETTNTGTEVLENEVSAEVESDVSGQEGSPVVGTETDSGAGEAQSTAGPDSTTSDQPDFRIDENGELQIADSVLADHLEPVKDPSQEATVDAAANPIEGVYTAEELARAFMDNSIDATKLPEGMRDYHNAIMAEHNRRMELQALARPKPNPQQLIPPPGQPPQPPAVPEFRLDREQYKQLRDGSKMLAAKYLGINPQDIDEYNQEHVDAMHLAQNDLKAKATQLFQQDIQNRYNQQVQQYQAHANAYQNQQKQIRMQQYHEMANEFKKHPNWADIDTNFYPQWHKALDQQTQASIQHVMQTGNLEGIRKIMNVVVQAYEAKNPAKAAKKVIKSVPSIMSTSDSADVSVRRGADASKLATMSPDEQAAWFTKNFV